MNTTKSERKNLRKIRNYFGENDKTGFEHWAYDFLNTFLNKRVQAKANESDKDSASGVRVNALVSDNRRWEKPETELPNIEQGKTVPVNIVVNSETDVAYYTNLGDGEWSFHTSEGVIIHNEDGPQRDKIECWAYTPKPPE